MRDQTWINLSAEEIAKQKTNSEIHYLLNSLNRMQSSDVSTRQDELRIKLRNAIHLQGVRQDIEEIEDIEDIEEIEEIPDIERVVCINNFYPCYAISDIGIAKDPSKESVNQDYIYSKDMITIVCDGLGSGQRSDEISKWCAHQIADYAPAFVNARDVSHALEIFNKYFQEISEKLKVKMSADPQVYQGAGTTIALVVNHNSGNKIVLTLGDSEVLKISDVSSVESVTNINLDTLYGYLFKELNMLDALSLVDNEFPLFQSKFRSYLTDKIGTKISTTTLNASSDFEFYQGLIQDLQGLKEFKHLIYLCTKFFNNESSFRQGKQAVVKGFPDQIQIESSNLSIIEKQDEDILLAVTDGLTDQMTLEQIERVFYYGAIKAMLIKINDPKLNSKYQEILNSQHVIDLSTQIDLKKIYIQLKNKLIKKEGILMFAKKDPESVREVMQLVKEAGTQELKKEAILNMLNLRLEQTGYKIPKKDNISIATL